MIPQWAYTETDRALQPWRENSSLDEDALVAAKIVEIRKRALEDAAQAAGWFLKPDDSPGSGEWNRCVMKIRSRIYVSNTPEAPRGPLPLDQRAPITTPELLNLLQERAYLLAFVESVAAMECYCAPPGTCGSCDARALLSRLSPASGGGA